MPNRTPIEWTDYSSNPVKARTISGKAGWACVRVSAGCQNCYSATLNRRLGTGLDYTVPALGRWYPYVDERELQRMLTFRPKAPFKNGRSRPAVFLEDMSDLFGEWVPDAWLDRIMAACALRPDVDWLFLTKRPERARAYLSDRNTEERIGMRRWELDGSPPVVKMPLPNVWMGASVENQATADERLPELLATPAAVRFVSYEPALGPADFTGITTPDGECWNALDREEARDAALEDACDGSLDWVIAGGESGPKARPCDMAWIRSIRDQCQAAGVPVFIKQLGAKANFFNDDLGIPDRWILKDRKGGDMEEWPEDLRAREMPK